MSSFKFLVADERGAAPLDRVIIIAGTAVVLLLLAQETFQFGVDTLVAMVESDTIAYSAKAGSADDVALAR